MSKRTLEKPKSAVLPGVEMMIPIAGLCGALKECSSVVRWNSRAKTANIFVGFGMESWSILGMGEIESYTAELGGEIKAWVAIDPRKLLSLLSTWAKSDDSLKVATGDRLQFSTPDGGSFSLNSVDGDDMLIPKAFNFVPDFEVSEGLAGMIHDAITYASTDSHRQVMQYVAILPDGNSSNVVATDTHCLYVAVCDQKLADPMYFPPVAARSVKEGSVICRFGEKVSMSLRSGRIVWSRMVGTFPKWEKVLPVPEESDAWNTDLCAADVIAATSRALIFARDNANRVRFSTDGPLVRVTGRSEDLGDIAVPVGLITGSGSCEFALNGTYAIKAMRTLGGTPHVRGASSARPFIFSNGAVRVVIMPMALA